MRACLARLFAGLVVAGALGCATSAVAQSLWDDPAFRLARQAQEALERKDYADAAELARQAIAEYPDHVLAYYLLAQAALAQQQWEEAVSALTTVVRLYPKSFAAQRELGVALAKLGRASAAERAFEAALALKKEGPEAQDAQMRLAFLLLQGANRDKALPLLNSLAAANTSVPEVWVALGRLLYEREQFAESERAYRRAAELRDDGKAWFNLGVIRLRLYDKPGAIEALKRAARHTDVQSQAAAELRKLGVTGSGGEAQSKPASKP